MRVGGGGAGVSLFGIEFVATTGGLRQQLLADEGLKQKEVKKWDTLGDQTERGGSS